jgi:23S rRNA (cytidine1920-2'-O)/16S rRNA (cytidine1409-2'-O)-methyltransferase
METKRLDAALVGLGFTSGREKAKELIQSGRVLVDGCPVLKPAAQVAADAVIQCDASGIKYVGRGGLKLEKALEVGVISLEGLTALDMGASTGGFTDCMLRRGASRVYAVDVGHGQLHPSLAADPRVVNLEGTDGRDTERLSAVIPKNSVHFASIDVSFISIKAIFPALLPFLTEDARLGVLIKPQFEAGRSAVGKNGVVKDPKVHRQVLREMCKFFTEQGCRVEHLTYSPITGGSASGAAKTGGNIESLAVLRRFSGAEPADPQPEKLVEAAFAALKSSK